MGTELSLCLCVLLPCPGNGTTTLDVYDNREWNLRHKKVHYLSVFMLSCEKSGATSLQRIINSMSTNHALCCSKAVISFHAGTLMRSRLFEESEAGEGGCELPRCSAR